jgi:hypothetical protein
LLEEKIPPKYVRMLTLEANDGEVVGEIDYFEEED